MVGASPADAAAVEAVLESRGPDGRGVLDTDAAWLVHRRLAVIDPTARSSQPFALAPEVVGLYNGELFNYRELSSRDASLMSRSDGDTEVFLRSLAGGVATMARTRGMYAGALVDTATGSASLSRDRYGVKPLYWTAWEDGLAFASQLRCFRGLLGSLPIAPTAIATFLRFGCVFSESMYEGVKEHELGAITNWGSRRTVTDPVERPAGQPWSRGELANVLRTAVRRNLTADVPVCLLLSGGLDSAALAAVGRASFEAAVTLSVGGDYDETSGARSTAAHYGIPHRVFRVSVEDARDAIDGFFANQDQPSIDGLNTFLLAQRVAEAGFKVAVAGVGADELLGGYSTFRRLLYGRMARWLPASLLLRAPTPSDINRAKLSRALANRGDPKELYLISREVFSPGEVQAMSGSVAPDPWADTHLRGLLERSGDVTLSGELGLYMRYMLLRDIDTQSMASSVEVRVPFLDEDLAETALRRSPLGRAVNGKAALGRALGDPYLVRLARQRKSGFRLPMREWLDGPFRPLLDKALTGGSALSEVIDVDVARALTTSNPLWSRRWALVVLNEWLERDAAAARARPGSRG